MGRKACLDQYSVSNWPQLRDIRCSGVRVWHDANAVILSKQCVRFALNIEVCGAYAKFAIYYCLTHFKAELLDVAPNFAVTKRNNVACTQGAFRRSAN